jgi:PadR family transcriptional regulator
LTIRRGPNIPEDETVKKEPPKNVQSEIVQGTLDLLVLKAVGPGPLHGLGVSRRIEQITNGTFSVKPGSLFPALHRIEAAGWLHSFWGRSESNRRARFYQLTKAGRRQLEVETLEWENVALAMSAALKAV